jgi:urea transport system permease protein
MIINSRFFNRSELIGFVALALLLFVILPLSLDVFRLNLVAKYLTYAFVAIGLVLCWGYGGILSLGQGVFFGLGGYCMAMFLKLEASSVENTRSSRRRAYLTSWTGIRSPHCRCSGSRSTASP